MGPDGPPPSIVDRRPARLDGDSFSNRDAPMIRAQISLTEAECRVARREAKRLGISLAELLRRPLRTKLPVDELRPWMLHAGMIESAHPHVIQTGDEIVSG